MKKFAVLVAGLVLGSVASSAQPLLTAAEVSPLLAAPDARVVDVRDPKAYAAGHIPGAVSAPYGQWRGPASNPGELPALPKLTTLVQSLGLTPQTRVVVVSTGEDTTDFGSAARIYWTLKVLGLKELSILNGGMKAWTSAGLPRDTAAVKPTASNYVPTIDGNLIATRDQVAAQMSTGKLNLVDARPAEFYLGETRHAAAKIPGTLPGAINLTHDKWFKPGTTTFVSPEEARKIAATASLNPQNETVAFCNTGHWAATDWFAMSEVAGLSNVKMYAGSMVDWTQAAGDHPMANVPSRGQQLVIDTRLWLDRTFK
jgi:thiosulfate/3-mercaptopyruvate sulfurtransferase